MEIPILILQDVSRQSGIVALEAAGDQQIDFQPENLRDLDPADVPQPRAYVPSERIVAAYQYARLPYRLTTLATRHTSESVLTALCESTEITSVPSTGRSNAPPGAFLASHRQPSARVGQAAARTRICGPPCSMASPWRSVKRKERILFPCRRE